LKTTALAEILGKTVASVVISTDNTSGPPSQVFLVFDDGTALEIYGQLQIAGGLDKGGLESARQYASISGGKLVVVKRET